MQKVLKHTCASEFQDQRYGTDMRVAILADGGISTSFVCTVCGKAIAMPKNKATDVSMRAKVRNAKGGGKKNRFWYEDATSVRKRFNRTRTLAARL